MNSWIEFKRSENSESISMGMQKSHLALCERLHKAGILSVQFEVGDKIARGFADLGAEEFQVIAQDRIISLFTGHQSDLLDSERRFFFELPDVDRLIEILDQKGVEIFELSRPNQRRWSLGVRTKSHSEIKRFESETLWESFALALLGCGTEIS